MNWASVRTDAKWNMSASGLPLLRLYQRRLPVLHIETSHENHSQRGSRVISLTGKLHLRAAQWAAHLLARLTTKLAAPLLLCPPRLAAAAAAAARRGAGRQRYATDACRGQFVRVSTVEARWAGCQCPATGPSVTPTVVNLFKEPPHRVRPCCTRSEAAQGAFLIEALISRLHGHSCHFF